MKSENLEDLKGRLYKAFDEAIGIAERGLVIDTANAAEFLKAAAQMTQSIVAIEREQREASEGRVTKLKVAP